MGEGALAANLQQAFSFLVPLVRPREPVLLRQDHLGREFLDRAEDEQRGSDRQVDGPVQAQAQDPDAFLQRHRRGRHAEPRKLAGLNKRGTAARRILVFMGGARSTPLSYTECLYPVRVAARGPDGARLRACAAANTNRYHSAQQPEPA
jgi:hypothetical protein